MPSQNKFHPCNICSLHEPCILPSVLWPLVALAAAQAHIHVATHINEGGSTLNWPSSEHIRDCSIAATRAVCMSRVYYLLYYRYQR